LHLSRIKTSMEEVVITGLGVASSLGHNPEELWQNLLAGKSGIANIERFDASTCASHFAGEVRNFDPSPYYEPRDAKRTARNIQYAVHSAITALQMAGIDPASVDSSRAGVIVGTGMGGMEVFQDNAIAMDQKGMRRISPFFVPMAISNMSAGEIGIRLGWMGANWSVTSACATGNHAIITAADQIKLGRADVMIAGGSEEAVCPIGVGGFNSMKALSTRNDDPQGASRPFDVNRDGFVISEGAGLVVLESRSHAEKRGAQILGILRGYGFSCDAHHMSAPREDGKGVIASIKMAIEMGGINLQDVTYVNTHGTSTPLGDVAETGAIYAAYEGKVDRLKVNSTKSMVGHALGAAAGIELIDVVYSLRDQKLHKTLNLEEQDPRIKLDCVAQGPIEHEMKYALSNSFGFGGHNSTLLIERP
jgi:3-oxoacyl-[acyl-carrier-protein] synthase II